MKKLKIEIERAALQEVVNVIENLLMVWSIDSNIENPLQFLTHIRLNVLKIKFNMLLCKELEVYRLKLNQEECLLLYILHLMGNEVNQFVKLNNSTSRLVDCIHQKLV